MDVLAEDNLCGGTLLRIVSRGSSIIAELFRLSSNVPPPFLASASSGAGAGEGAGFEGLMFDFDYWKRPEEYESKVNSTESLASAEDAFQQTFVSVLSRFYTLFSSMVTYHASATIYSPECGGWFLPNGTEVCGISTISLLRKSIGIPGLVGVYKVRG